MIGTAINPSDWHYRASAECERREAALDETIAQSFPAIDPPVHDPNPYDHTAVARRASTVDT